MIGVIDSWYKTAALVKRSQVNKSKPLKKDVCIANLLNYCFIFQ